MSSASPVEGRILGVVGAERSASGLRLLVRWAEDQPPESLPSRVVNELWPAHVIAFYQGQTVTAKAPATAQGPDPAPPSKPVKTEAGEAPETKEPAAAAKKGSDPQPKTRPPPRAKKQAAPKASAATMTPRGQAKKRARSSWEQDSDEPAAKKAVGRAAPLPGPSWRRSESPEAPRTRACRQPGLSYADWDSGEEEDDGAEDLDDFDGSDWEESGGSEGESEGEGDSASLPKSQDAETPGQTKLSFPSMVLAVMAASEGPGKDRGLNRLTLMDRVPRRFGLRMSNRELAANVVSGLKGLLKRSMVELAATGRYPDGPFVLTPKGRSEPMKESRSYQGTGKRTQTISLGPFVKAELEGQADGVSFAHLLARLPKHFEEVGAQLPKALSPRHDALKCKLRRFVNKQLATGGLELGPGGDKTAGPFVEGEGSLAGPGWATMVRKGIAALDAPEGFTMSVLRAWARARCPQGTTKKQLNSVSGTVYNTVTQDVAKGRLRELPGAQPKEGPFRLAAKL